MTLGREAAAAAPGGARIAVQYFGNEDDAQELVHELAGASVAPVLCEALPAVLAAHTGAGVLAVAVAPVPTALLPASPLGGPLPGGPAAARPSRGPSPRESSSRERVQEGPRGRSAENAPATEPTRTPNALQGRCRMRCPVRGRAGHRPHGRTRRQDLGARIRLRCHGWAQIRAPRPRHGTPAGDPSIGLRHRERHICPE